MCLGLIMTSYFEFRELETRGEFAEQLYRELSEKKCVNLSDFVTLNNCFVNRSVLEKRGDNFSDYVIKIGQNYRQAGGNKWFFTLPDCDDRFFYIKYSAKKGFFSGPKQYFASIVVCPSVDCVLKVTFARADNCDFEGISKIYSFKKNINKTVTLSHVFLNSYKSLKFQFEVLKIGDNNDNCSLLLDNFIQFSFDKKCVESVIDMNNLYRSGRYNDSLAISLLLSRNGKGNYIPNAYYAAKNLMSESCLPFSLTTFKFQFNEILKEFYLEE